MGKYISLDEWNEKVGRHEEGAKYNDPEVNDAEKCDFSMSDDSFAVKSGFEKLK